MTEPKKRGRQSLSLEEREIRRKEKIRRDNERKKAQGWVAQKKYRANHPSRERVYEPKIRIPLDKKAVLTDLLEKTGLSITQLCIGAVEEKYGVSLRNNVDKSTGS